MMGEKQAELRADGQCRRSDRAVELPAAHDGLVSVRAGSTMASADEVGRSHRLSLLVVRSSSSRLSRPRCPPSDSLSCSRRPDTPQACSTWSKESDGSLERPWPDTRTSTR